jgi:voltage-gated potassium channel
MATSLRHKLNRIIFKSDTRAGKIFDIVLLWLIVMSVLVVLLESVPSISKSFAKEFYYLELGFTLLFSIEYISRILVADHSWRYIKSYWGIIDFLGILPTLLGIFIPSYHFFIVFRLLRMLRVFRILRLFRFIQESDQLYNALKASMYKIIVFFGCVLTVVVLLGTLMYVVEGPKNGFGSIPQSIYWTIVTITTVGYGDITPQTDLGKWIASIIMLVGFAIIAIPTGIVTAEMSKTNQQPKHTCPRCQHLNPEFANFCNNCGNKMVSSE